jgi:hypothetical protein
MFCSKCGNAISNESKFCRQCGHEVKPRTPTQHVSGGSGRLQGPSPYSASPGPIAMPGGSFPKKRIAIACILLVVVIAIGVFFFGGSPLVGTWEQGSGNYRARIVFNRNGEGMSFEADIITGQRNNEISFRWKIESSNQLRIEIAGTSQEGSYRISKNEWGDEVLELRQGMNTDRFIRVD